VITEGHTALRGWMSRTRYKLPQASQILGVSKSYLCDLIAGNRTPGLDVAFRLQDACGVPARAWIRPGLHNPSDPDEIASIGPKTKGFRK
jgi:plasmid maintenance system antidote protein VapI